MRRHHRHLATASALLLAVAATACADDDDGAGDDPITSDDVAEDVDTGAMTSDEVADDVDTGEAADDGQELTTTLMRLDGQELGTVTVREDGDGVVVEADLDGFERAGFHGFHLHAEPECDPDDPEGPFESAGGHLGGDDADHASHAGDLSALLAGDDGRAALTVRTDRVTFEELATDGAAVMVHADPDNHGNVPDRYIAEDADEPGPDEDTLDTGDAGDRFACGVIGGDDTE